MDLDHSTLNGPKFIRDVYFYNCYVEIYSYKNWTFVIDKYGFIKFVATFIDGKQIAFLPGHFIYYEGLKKINSQIDE